MKKRIKYLVNYLLVLTIIWGSIHIVIPQQKENSSKPNVSLRCILSNKDGKTDD